MYVYVVCDRGKVIQLCCGVLVGVVVMLTSVVVLDGWSEYPLLWSTTLTLPGEMGKNSGVQLTPVPMISDGKSVLGEVFTHDGVLDSAIIIHKVRDWLPSCLLLWVTQPKGMKHELLVLPSVADNVFHDEVQQVFLCVSWRRRSCWEVSSAQERFQLQDIENVVCFTLLS